jgi:hypothetical protein
MPMTRDLEEPITLDDVVYDINPIYKKALDYLGLKANNILSQRGAPG